MHSLERTFHGCFLPSCSSFGWGFSEKNIFRNRPIRNKNCLWWPCLLANWDEMSNLYREPSNDASYQMLVHFRKRFQRRRFFRTRPIRNKNCLWRPCLLTERGVMSNHYRGPSIDATYQVTVYLTLGFQRKRLLEIDQSETRIDCGGHVCNRIATKRAIVIEDLP